ncbi:MAG: hypothetical protein HKN27_04515 [Silicimonas sp.]|nr:hypothetical protein [Silicimonas sp.]
MIKSAHPDVSLWSYDRPSRGYFGYHLRAGSYVAREKLCQKLTDLNPSDSIVLRFGATLGDVVKAGWTRTDYGFVTLVRDDTPAQSDQLSIAIPDDSWPVFLALLEQVEVHDEGSVNVVTPNGHMPLWVWWDAE